METAVDCLVAMGNTLVTKATLGPQRRTTDVMDRSADVSVSSNWEEGTAIEFNLDDQCGLILRAIKA